FMEAYGRNIGAQNVEALDSSMIAETLLSFLDAQDADPFGERIWGGTATALLDALTAQVSGTARLPTDWPRKPHVLSGHLKRLAPNLRTVGVEIQFTTPHGKRLITIRKQPSRERSNRSESSDEAGDAQSEPEAKRSGDPVERSETYAARSNEQGNAW